MKKSTYFLAVLQILHFSCNRPNNPVNAPLSPQNEVHTLTKTSSNTVTITTINNYQVQFDGRTFDSNKNQTIFSYTVRGMGIQPALSHFTIELPPCAPNLASFNPTNSVSINLNPTTGIFGIEWHLQVEPDPSQGRSYSITFPGNIKVGEVRASVKSGSTIGVSAIPGPCAGFDISGTIFVDADSNGIMNGIEESGIVNVTVVLVDGNGAIINTTTTDVNGDYVFRKLPGTYTVRIDPVTAANDFNEQLAQSFNATTATSLSVTVGPDSPGNEFGFAPKTKKIIDDLESGNLSTNGESVKFWQKQLRAAVNNSKGKVEFDAVTLQGFLSIIDTLFLDIPFQFTPGNELQEALDILSNNSKDEVDELQKELLTTEFNEVSGKGIINVAGLQSVLISWGESLVKQNLPLSVLAPTYGSSSAATSSSELDEAIVLFNLLNSSGGGGGIGE